MKIFAELIPKGAYDVQVWNHGIGFKHDSCTGEKDSNGFFHMHTGMMRWRGFKIVKIVEVGPTISHFTGGMDIVILSDAESTKTVDNGYRPKGIFIPDELDCTMPMAPTKEIFESWKPDIKNGKVKAPILTGTFKSCKRKNK